MTAYIQLVVISVLSAIFISTPIYAQDEEQPNRIMFTNVNVFDGVNDTLKVNTNVLVENNLIARVGPTITLPEGTEVIDGGGRTLMPGVVDAHAHLAFHDSNPLFGFNERQWSYQGAAMGKDAELMLLRGFTTIRDACGETTGLMKAINDGRAVGPRILSSGACISMTSGHGDATGINQQNPTLTGAVPFTTLLGHTFVVDGKDKVIAAVRQNMRQGAAQIKIMADGGVSTVFDKLGVIQFTPEEIRAAVEEATRWGTYVFVHAFTDEAVRHAIDAGVKVIDHGPLITEETAKLMKDKGIWFVPQFRAFASTPEEFGLVDPVTIEKGLYVAAGAQNMFKVIKKVGLTPAFGMDFFGAPAKAVLQSEEFQARVDRGYSSAEVMIQATSFTAKMFELSGERHPYREGPLGVIKEGAYADILLVDGNPLEDASIMGDYENNLRIIMKDGVIYKNTL